MFKKKASEPFRLSKPLNHVAFIMDGNGRWAKKRLLPRHLGHKEGCQRIIEIFDVCKEMKIKVMTLFAFSTENWKRPQDEINHLFDYLQEFFEREIDHLMRDGVQVRTMGDLSRLPLSVQKTISDAKERTKYNQQYVFNICLNYGGRAEIIKACNDYAQAVSEGKRPPNSMNEESFAQYLYSSGLPEVDLLIRTSGEQRLSNFLLWQLAYAEIIFEPTPWPAFTRKEFLRCLKEYDMRDRRYGGLSNGQIAD